MTKKDLHQRGFIRVDGLRVVRWDYPQGKVLSGKLHSGPCPRIGENNGFIAVNFPDGEIWISSTANPAVEEVRNLAKRQGWSKGCYVPCSNGEEIDLLDFLTRIGDPNYVPKDSF